MMTDWNRYKKAAKERGALALELFVVESTPAKSPDEVKACLSDHLQYQRSLEEAGKLVFAGPLSDSTGPSCKAQALSCIVGPLLMTPGNLRPGIRCIDPAHAVSQYEAGL